MIQMIVGLETRVYEELMSNAEIFLSEQVATRTDRISARMVEFLNIDIRSTGTVSEYT